MPGPFEYSAGIGRFTGVGKFDALNGVDVRALLFAALDDPPSSITFLNDAAAFGIGEWVSGAGKTPNIRRDRLVAITLGTGVGSAFIDAGTLVNRGPRVPDDGYVHTLRVDGRLLEDVMSTRAITASYVARVGARKPPGDIDVRSIALRANSGDVAAVAAFADAAHSLGTALGPWLKRFEADHLVVGGGIAQAWPLVEPALRAGITEAERDLDRMSISPSPDPEASVETGAAWFAHH